MILLKKSVCVQKEEIASEQFIAAISQEVKKSIWPPKMTSNFKNNVLNDNPILEIRKLSMNFPVRGVTVLPWKDSPIIRAVDEVDFKIMPNQIFGLAAKFGCGKSTIARLLIGAINKTQGEILFEGKKWRTILQENSTTFTDGISRPIHIS